MPVLAETCWASSIRPRLTSQATDSGILKYANGSSVTSGSAPIQNSPRQPIAPSSRMPRSAASRLPNGTPEYVMALHRFFFPGGANSETIAPVVATRAPTPMPVRNRPSPNIAALVASAVKPMNTANQA